MRRRVNASQLNELAAGALDTDGGNAFAIALQRDGWFPLAAVRTGTGGTLMQGPKGLGFGRRINDDNAEIRPPWSGRTGVSKWNKWFVHGVAVPDENAADWLVLCSADLSTSTKTVTRLLTSALATNPGKGWVSAKPETL